MIHLVVEMSIWFYLQMTNILDSQILLPFFLNNLNSISLRVIVLIATLANFPNFFSPSSAYVWTNTVSRVCTSNYCSSSKEESRDVVFTRLIATRSRCFAVTIVFLRTVRLLEEFPLSLRASGWWSKRL